MFKLVIQDDEGKTTVVPLIRDEITIGRKEGNTIRLTERNVSRRHARIARSNGAVQIEDLDSYNGILVNGTRIDGRSKLAESDRVQIGDYLIELRRDSADSREGPAARTNGERNGERIDPLAKTPVPEPISDVSSDAKTRPVSAKDAAIAPGASGEAIAMRQAGLADTDPGVAAQAAPAARLVIVSSNFAGREFALDKPASVIGRTDDNDIVVNHRSISRHHAKVVQEQGRFAVVDLQSSNGVRVNGEDYGKVELRRGDVIDLGHVRFRFVEAGEDFVLGRDAQIVDLNAEGEGRRGLLWAVIALIVIGVAATVALTRNGGESKSAGPSTAAPGPGNASSTLATGAIPGSSDTTGPAQLPPANDPSTGRQPSLIERISLAKAARDDERWADMQAAAADALEIDPANAEARMLKEQGERELANQLAYREFSEAVAGSQYAAVAQIFRKLDSDSVYRHKAQDDHDRMRDEYVEKVRAEATQLASSSSCKELRILVRDGAYWPEAKAVAEQQLNECLRVARTAVPPRNGRPPTNRQPPRGRDDSGPIEIKPDQPDTSPGDQPDEQEPRTNPKPTRSADELANEAGAAARRGEFGAALTLCENALDLRASNPHARMVCTLAACRVGNVKRAKHHWSRLSAAARRMALSQCSKYGVELE